MCFSNFTYFNSIILCLKIKNKKVKKIHLRVYVRFQETDSETEKKINCQYEVKIHSVHQKKAAFLFACCNNNSRESTFGKFDKTFAQICPIPK